LGATGLATLLCAGCGGGGDSAASPTVGESVGEPLARVIAKADARCAEGNRQLAKLHTPPLDPAHAGAAQLRSAAPYLREVAAIIGSEVEGAAAAGTPSSKAAQLERAIEDSRRLVKAMERQARAAAAGDPEAFHAASEETEASPAGRELGALGFKVCGRG
jgi:hypothetical protein